MVSTEEQVARWIREARSVVALTGAGISTESGIPDFRGPNGVWTKNPGAERLSNIHAYLADSATRAEVWQMRISHPAWTAAPNSGHLTLVDLERRGHLSALITQNIDGLHAIAGSTPEALVEMHGTMREVICLSCDDRGPAQPTFDRVLAGDPDPACLHCGGILKSATISFGQSLLADDLDRAEAAASRCDLMIAIGTSLLVYPVAALPQVALDRGARLVIVNAQPTPYDARASAVLREPIGEVLPRIAALV